MKPASKDLVGIISFKSQHRFSIEALIEYDQKGYPRDTLFLTMDADMKGSNLIIMSIESNDLGNIVHAAKELLAVGYEIVLQNKAFKRTTSYRKFTKSSRFSTTLFFGVKSKPVYSKKDKAIPSHHVAVYYLNMRREGITYSISFDKYGLNTFIDKCVFLIQKLDDALFEAQIVSNRRSIN